MWRHHIQGRRSHLAMNVSRKVQRRLGRRTPRMIIDVEKLAEYSAKRSIPTKDAQQLFFDAITQKVLLEKLGAATSIISTAMQ
jgi:porphobilinogen deaminase